MLSLQQEAALGHLRLFVAFMCGDVYPAHGCSLAQWLF